MPRFIVISLILILAVHFAGNAFFWYDRLFWLDIVMHLLGGAWVAVLSVYLFGEHWPVIGDKAKPSQEFILILGSVALVGVLWEFYEFLADVYVLKIHPLNLAPDPKVLPDTIADLLNDLIGGSLAFFFLKFSKRKSAEN